MSEQLSSSVRTVSLYQEIWYLVNKYSIPVTDHDQDIVILIDNICRGVTKKPEPVLDNSIEIDAPARVTSDSVATMVMVTSLR